LKTPAVGFDISDKSIRYIQFGIKKNRLFIKQFGEKKLPDGIIEAGEIKKEDEFTSFLKTQFKNTDIKYAVVSLPEEKSLLDIIELPKMDRREIRKNLNLQLENYFPIKSNEAVFDYEILNARTDSQNFFDILAAVFPLRVVKTYQKTFMAAGIKPLAFESETEALKTALLEENNPPEMIVDFGKTRSTFAVFVKNNVLFTSTVKIGGEDLDRVLAKSLTVSVEEAEKIKKEKGAMPPFHKNYIQNQNQNDEEKEIQSILVPTISALRQEIEKYILYWQGHYSHIHNKNTGINIKEIILCGGDANLPGLPEYLSLTLKLPVKLANVWRNVFSLDKYIPEIEFNNSLKFATAVGLGLKAKNAGWI